MGKELKKLPGVPKWLYEKPTGTKKKIMNDQAYKYLLHFALQGTVLQSSTEWIPGFIVHLTAIDPDFGKIKKSMQKTGYDFIEGMRVEIKNSITKIKREITEKKVVPFKEEEGNQNIELENNDLVGEKANEDLPNDD